MAGAARIGWRSCFGAIHRTFPDCSWHPIHAGVAWPGWQADNMFPYLTDPACAAWVSRSAIRRFKRKGGPSRPSNGRSYDYRMVPAA